MVPLIHITADEVNHIIYAYLQDSGFEHTAYALHSEGRLDKSTHFNDHIPRGELVELLTKALLYIEVETHCKGYGLITDCKVPFTLLKKHECSLESLGNGANGTKSIPEKPVVESNGIVDVPAKRKADTAADGDGSDRRVKRSIEPEASDANSVAGVESSAIAVKDTTVTPTPDPESRNPSVPPLGDTSKKRIRKTSPGPGDKVTPKKAILLLPGHESEVGKLNIVKSFFFENNVQVFVCAWNKAVPQLLATGSKDATVRIWNLKEPPKNEFADVPEDNPIVLRHLPDSNHTDITSLDWSPDGKLLATGSYDAVLRVWTASGQYYLSHPQHLGPIFATRFSKSGQWLLSASLDGTACVWDVPGKKLFQQFRCHEECCLDVDWFDESTFASCGADKLIHIMRLGTNSPLRTLRGHENEVNQIKFSPSGTRLASCSDDNTARIWTVGKLNRNIHGDPFATIDNTITSPPCITLVGHTDSIGSIGWCPKTSEGSPEIIATCSFDSSVRLWDTDTGKCLRAIFDNTRASYTLSFSPSGKYIATGGGDGWLYVYDVLSGKQVWSWFAGSDKPGIYEIEWQQTEKLNRIAMCLESRMVGIVDCTKVPALAS